MVEQHDFILLWNLRDKVWKYSECIKLIGQDVYKIIFWSKNNNHYIDFKEKLTNITEIEWISGKVN